MRGFLLYLLIILWISVPDEDSIHSISDDMIADMHHIMAKQTITPMEALDLVKERYAANFDKVYEDTEDNYYYELPFADLFLAYEGEDGKDKNYLIHLYEFVVDESETGIGHMVTYGWYSVDRISGFITAA